MFPPIDRLTTDGVWKLFWKEQKGPGEHAPLEPALLQVLDIQAEQLSDIVLMVLSDGYVKIKVRVIGNARMLVEKGYLKPFDVVAVPLSQVRLTGSSPEQLRSNPWLQALIINDMVVKLRNVGKLIGQPMELDTYKEVSKEQTQQNGNLLGDNKIDLPKSDLPALLSNQNDSSMEKELTDKAIASQSLAVVQKENAEQHRENSDESKAPKEEVDAELLELLEAERENQRRQDFFYDSVESIAGLKLPQRISFKGFVTFISALNQKQKHYFNFSVKDKNRKFLDGACFGYQAPRFYRQLRTGRSFLFRNVTVRKNNLHPQKVQLILEHETMVEECKEEQPELQISTFEEAKTKGGNSINIIARVRGVIQREKNRTVHLVDNRDYLTLTVWEEHKDKKIEDGYSYLFANVRKVTSRLDRQELSSTRGTEIIPEKEAHTRFKMVLPAPEIDRMELDDEPARQRPIQSIPPAPALSTLRDVAACQTDRKTFQLRAMLTFPGLQMFAFRNLFRVRCPLCKSDPYDFNRIRCQNCDAELDIKFNVNCELEDELETLSADLSTFVLEKELGLRAVDALSLFNSNEQEKLARKFRELEYREYMMKVGVTIGSQQRRYIKVSYIFPEQSHELQWTMRVVRDNLKKLSDQH